MIFKYDVCQQYSLLGDGCAQCTIDGCVPRLRYGCWCSSRTFRGGEADIVRVRVRGLLRTPRLTGGCPCSRSLSENNLAPAVFRNQKMTSRANLKPRTADDWLFRGRSCCPREGLPDADWKKRTAPRRYDRIPWHFLSR